MQKYVDFMKLKPAWPEQIRAGLYAHACEWLKIIINT